MNNILHLCCDMHNELLEYMKEHKGWTRTELNIHIKNTKQLKPEYKHVYAQTLQHITYQIHKNIIGLARTKRKHGYLRFKPYHRYKSFKYTQLGFKLNDNRLTLSKIGDVKIKLSRPLNSKIKNVIIIKKIDKWYAHIVVDNNTPLMKHGNGVIGIDLGIKHYLTTSTGEQVKNPLPLKQSLGKLRIINKSISRSKKGSNTIKKKYIQREKLLEHITNQRMDYLHKLTTTLVKQNQFIAMEDLNIKSMLKTKYYNHRNTLDTSWGLFTQLLTYKAESAGCKLIKVDPKNTSKMCSKCGALQDMPLSKRTYRCECGNTMDRDLNASINILNLGLGTGSAYVETMLDPSGLLSMKQEGITI